MKVVIKSVLFFVLILFSTACVSYKAASYDQETNLLCNYEKNYSVTLPSDYVQVDQEEKEKILKTPMWRGISFDNAFVFKKDKSGDPGVYAMICSYGKYSVAKNDRAKALKEFEKYNKKSYCAERGFEYSKTWIEDNCVITEVVDSKKSAKICATMVKVSQKSSSSTFIFFALVTSKNEFGTACSDFDKILPTLKTTVFTDKERKLEKK